jgi:hypothetical protein
MFNVVQNVRYISHGPVTTWKKPSARSLRLTVSTVRLYRRSVNGAAVQQGFR